MSQGPIANYQGAANGNPYEVVDGPEGQKLIGIYNNTGGALANGLVKQVAFLVDATDTDNPIIKAVPVAVATEAVGVVRLCVIDNSLKGKSTIPDAEWGYAVIQGFCYASCDGTNDIAVGDQLEVLNTATSFIVGAAASSGASGALVDECAAIAMEAYTDSSAANKKVYLVGWQCVVKGS